MKKECTLSDGELIERCEQWVHDLAETGGERWTLSVPVNFNRDPDMLFIELGKRFGQAALELEAVKAERDELVMANNRLKGDKKDYEEMADRFLAIESERDRLKNDVARLCEEIDELQGFEPDKL